jgi:hypothetical protein
VGQVATDVVYGEVLFAQGDDTVAEGIGLGCGMRPLGRCEEEVASRVLAELVDEDSEAPRRVTEAASDLGMGVPSTKKARRASYWRWVALVGSRKTWERSVSFFALLVNMLPK